MTTPLLTKSVAILIIGITAVAIVLPLIVKIEHKSTTTNPPVDIQEPTNNTTAPSQTPTAAPTQTLLDNPQLISAIISQRGTETIDYPVIEFKCEAAFCGQPKLLVPTTGLCNTQCSTAQSAATKTAVPGHTEEFTRCTLNKVMTDFDCSGFSCDHMTFRCCDINPICKIAETYDTVLGVSGGKSTCDENQVMTGARWKQGSGLLDILCSDVTIA